MKLTIEHEGKKFEITTDSIAIDDVIDDIESILLGVGFHPSTIKRGFITKVDNY